MDHLKDLENFIWNLGLFSDIIRLTITIESEFEGFYGKASETWEKQVCITIESKDEKRCPNIRVVGARGDDMDCVALEVLTQIKLWKSLNE